MNISKVLSSFIRGAAVGIFALSLFLSSNSVHAAGEPVAADDSYNVNEDAVLMVPATGVLGNDTPGANVLTAVLATNVSHGILVLNSDGSFEYTPAANYAGTDSFTYYAHDSLDGDSLLTATVTITVDSVDDTPVAGNDSFATDVNVALAGQTNLLANDSDVEGAVTVVPAFGPTTGGGTYEVYADGSFDYTPALDFTGDDTFTYIATDGLLTSSAATVTITVSKLAQAITFADPSDQVYGDATSVVVAPTADSGLTVDIDVTGDCSVLGFTVSFTDAGSCTVTASQTGNAIYAVATPVVQSFTIAPRAITVNATTADKVYDTGDTSSAIPTLFAGTLAVGDVAVYSQTYASVNVANGLTINPLATINGNPANPNYAITYNTSSGNISPASLTASVTAADKVYDGDTLTTAAPTVSPLGADDVTVSYGAANFDTKDVGTGKLVTVTGITLGGVQAGNYTLTSATETTTAAITQKALSAEVTVGDKMYDNTTDAAITGYTPVGLVGLETVTIDGGVAAFASEHVGTHPVSVSGLNLVMDPVSANYSFTDSDTTTASITVRPVTVTAQANSKVYDGFDTSATDAAITSIIALASGDTATFTQTYDSTDVGTALSISPTVTDIVDDGNGGNNYTVTYVPANVGTITKAPLTITADDKAKTYGDANPIATATYTGFVAGEDHTDLDTDVTLVIVANNQTDVNNHPITAFGAADSNYDITHVNGNLEITKRPITVTVAAPSKVYDGDTVTSATLAPVGVLFSDVVTASHSGVTFDTKNVGTGKTVTAAGITLGGPDAGNYSVAASATGAADITTRSLHVSAIANTKVYGAADPVLGYTSDILSGDAFIGTLGRAAGENVGTYAMNVGTLDAGSNYNAITFTPADLSITPAALTVTADDKTKTYNTANPALTVTYSGFRNGDDENGLGTVPTATTLADINSNVGDWIITPNSGADANYTFTYVNGTLTVTKADQTITFTSLSDRNFGENDFAVSGSSTSLLNVVFAASGACTITGNTVHLTTKGSCTITASQTGDANWNSAADISQSFTVSDNTAPVITLLGNAAESVTKGNTYLDGGAIAQDDVEGSLTANIVVINPVNTDALGTYIITYNVTDTSSNVATTVTRTVEVVARHGGGGSSAVPIASVQGRVLGASSYNFSSDLSLGSRGNDVAELQKVLIGNGFLNIAAPTGFYGPMTAAAVKLYQTAHGIRATGYVGPRTLAALNAEGTPARTIQEQIAELTAKLKALQAQLGQ